MIQVEEVSCCALQCIRQAAAWIQSDPKAFDNACKKGHGLGNGYAGTYIMGTIVLLSDQGFPDMDKNPAVIELKKRGWKRLGTLPGAHAGGYRMHLWGSEAFEEE